ncbi:MAG: XRE family transcriptional regulator [Pseudonocardiaceae bacterium]|nr:MAG: XRE family transcriptional regulator [Pseudonocardiaceae bacterium]
MSQGIRLALAMMPQVTKLDRAARLGVNPYTLDRWTSGASTPTPSNIARLSAASGVSAEEIRNGRLAD